MSETKEQEAPQEGDFKIKTAKKIKPKQFNEPSNNVAKIDLSKIDNTQGEVVDNVTKLDLTKIPKDDAIQIGETKKVDVGEQTGDSAKLDTEVQEPVKIGETKEKDEVVISEITEEVKEEPLEYTAPKIELPENIEKLVDFMKETGGTIDDYARLNADYTNVDNDVLLKEYYKKAKPHLNEEEINFIMEDNFKYDEDEDEERDIRKKKLAKKEEVAKAKGFLEDLKKEYYDEIKLRPGVNQEQQKAVDFFNRYNDEQKLAKQRHERFLNDTKQIFSDDFKGFDFEVGEKKYRYGVKNPKKLVENQSNINNIIGKFLDKEGNVKDTKGYHKAMYAAENIDNIISHFYEQGKADGVKNIVETSKNPDTNVRKTSSGEMFIDGFKIKSVGGVSSSKLKIKTRKINN